MGLLSVQTDRMRRLVAAVVTVLVCGAGAPWAEPQSASSDGEDALRWIIDLKRQDAANVERDKYRAFVDESGKLASEAVHALKPLPPVGYFLHIDWRIHTENLAGTEQSLLAQDFGTINVKTTIPRRKTEYVIRRDGTRLTFDGRYQGEPLHKTVDIDENPFFTNPTIGMRGFVLSGNDEGRFWMLRPDNLKVYRIKARRLEVDTLSVGGRSIEAVRVEWGLTGIKSLFYKRVYWFRKSDGLFVKAEEADGLITVWMGEQS